MKMIYGGVPVNSLKVKHYEISTNDCDMVASDLQAGKTAVARGQKIVGTGKCFEFAWYGRIESNDSIIIPINTINVVHVSSLDYPTRSLIHLGSMSGVDFTSGQIVCTLIDGENEYPVTVSANNNEVYITCDANACFEIFFGKDNYV